MTAPTGNALFRLVVPWFITPRVQKRQDPVGTLSVSLIVPATPVDPFVFLFLFLSTMDHGSSREKSSDVFSFNDDEELTHRLRFIKEVSNPLSPDDTLLKACRLASETGVVSGNVNLDPQKRYLLATALINLSNAPLPSSWSIDVERNQRKLRQVLHVSNHCTSQMSCFLLTPTEDYEDGTK